MVVKDDADTVGVVLWQHLLGAPCFRAGFCSKTIIPDSEEHPLASSRAVPKDVLRWIRVNAGQYRNRPHWVLVVPTDALLEHHADKVTLSDINSGSLYPSKATGVPRMRGRSTFRVIDEFRSRWVAELAVDYAVPNMAQLAERVEEWQGKYKLRVIWEARY